MRITFELVENAYQFITPLKERAVSLRGFKISVIENLGTTQNAYECIDLSDNQIVKLENVPPLTRLKSLMLTNNNISCIESDFGENLPSLISLVLTQNNFRKLSNLLPLKNLKSLERLSLLDNPVSADPYFRTLIIHLIPTIKFINFQRVSIVERETSQSFFTGPQGKELWRSLVEE